jgi:lipopolysaccharide biosynthesis glycosyltransferase
MKISVITSFNKHYYDTIGNKSVSSWLKYWPDNISLTCYVEEFNLPFSNSRITEIPFDCLPNEYFEFQKDINLKPRVKTFAKKAYSIIHAFENNIADRIIWIDADVISTNSLSVDFLENLCPDDTLLSYMRVWHNIDRLDPTSEEVPSAESGFFIVNTKHLEFKNFSSRYREYYNLRITKNLRRFYDGEVLGAVAKEFENKCKIIDLCQVVEKRYNSPLRHLPAGKYLTHYKSKHSKDQFDQN